MSASHAVDAPLERAWEATRESRRQATEDVTRQSELLAHEKENFTVPLRNERVTVNHFSSLVRDALQASYENRHRGESA